MNQDSNSCLVFVVQTIFHILIQQLDTMNIIINAFHHSNGITAMNVHQMSPLNQLPKFRWNSKALIPGLSFCPQ